MKALLHIHLLGILIFLQPHSVYAQKAKASTGFASGSWQFGLKEGYGSGNIYPNRNGLHLFAGRYVTNKLLVGLGAAWSKEWNRHYNGYSFHDLSVGPFVRYQFTTTRFSPFVEASYQLCGRNSIQGVETAIINGYATVTGKSPTGFVRPAFISPGLSIRLGKPLRLDLSYSFQYTFLTNNTPSLDSFEQAQIGLNYSIGFNN